MLKTDDAFSGNIPQPEKKIACRKWQTSMTRGFYRFLCLLCRLCSTSIIEYLSYRQFAWINFCHLVAPIFRGKFRISFTNKSGLKKSPRTANCPKNLHVKNKFISWPLTSSRIIVLVAWPILTDGWPPAWAVDKRAELGWPSTRGKRVARRLLKWPTFN